MRLEQENVDVNRPFILDDGPPLDSLFVDVDASVVDESDSLRTQVLFVSVIQERDSNVHVFSDDVAGNSTGCFEAIATAGFANLALNV